MPDPEDEEEFTELIGAQFSRVDLVHAPANGSPGFLVMKQDAGAAGLFDGEFVRTLVGKSEPAPEPSDTGQVTMTGSPAAIAAFIHKAAVRAADPEDGESAGVRKAKAAYDLIVKAKYSAEDRRKMAGNGQAMKDGSYPVKDDADLDNAIHAVGRG